MIQTLPNPCSLSMIMTNCSQNRQNSQCCSAKPFDDQLLFVAFMVKVFCSPLDELMDSLLSL